MQRRAALGGGMSVEQEGGGAQLTDPGQGRVGWRLHSARRCTRYGKQGVSFSGDHFPRQVKLHPAHHGKASTARVQGGSPWGTGRKRLKAEQESRQHARDSYRSFEKKHSPRPLRHSGPTPACSGAGVLRFGLLAGERGRRINAVLWRGARGAGKARGPFRPGGD